MLHLRLTGPRNDLGEVLAALRANPYVFDLGVLPATDQAQQEDVVECDVLVGAANELLRSLRSGGAGERISLTVSHVELATSEPALHAERKLLGPLARAPVWEMVQARIRANAVYRPSFYLLLVAAGIIGAVGILTNSQILVIGAMVVGPEYGAIANVALGISRREMAPVRKGLGALLAGFALALAAAYVFATVAGAMDRVPIAYDNGLRPVSHLVGTPNFYSLVVAVTAGTVGAVSLTLDRTGTLLGVFISATTIPAAADAGVAWALVSWDYGLRSLAQLGLNLVVLIGVGALTMVVLRVIWRRVGSRSPQPAATP
ncbi:DUF389 domain-containing protein [Streptomyces sp. A7024]|uniref:DUF389 domain-containing protein n=2 Tax=Streptomyces coryli TaxID=1128680 RepID=A0A6G4TXS2_9ACTN|nr:DUF389 domain-containing protein [Streptomyces coryli]